MSENTPLAHRLSYSSPAPDEQPICRLERAEDCVDDAANEAIGIQNIDSTSELLAVMTDDRAKLKKTFDYACCSCLVCCLCLPCLPCFRYVVPSGEIGLTQHKGAVMMTPPGVVWTLSPHENFVGSRKMDDATIQHGNALSIVTISAGNIGVVSNNGKIHFLRPGRYCWKSATCNFARSVPISSRDEWIQLHLPYFFHIVKNNTNSIVQIVKTGELVLLSPGLYMINTAMAVARTTIATNMITSKIEEECRTMDNHCLHVTFSTSRIITDPLTFIRNVEKPEEFLAQNFDAAVTQVVASFKFADLINTTTNQFLTSADNAEDGNLRHRAAAEDADHLNPSLFDNRKELQEKCLQVLYEKLLAYGIQLKSMSLIDIKVVDKVVNQQISTAASNTVQMQNELRLMEIRQDIAVRNRELQEREAEANGAGAMVNSRNAAERCRIEAQAKADALKMEADGRAEYVERVGMAEAKAIRAKADAEVNAWVEGMLRNPGITRILLAKQQAAATSSARIVGSSVFAMANEANEEDRGDAIVAAAAAAGASAKK